MAFTSFRTFQVPRFPGNQLWATCTPSISSVESRLIPKATDGKQGIRMLCAGSTARLSFSLKYAAPEVVHALEAGCATIHVDAAVDMWAVGVIAYELLTGEPAMLSQGWPSDQSKQPMQDAIAGRTLLPWEEDGETAVGRLKKLRGLRRTVLRCLERDPCKRPTADALLASWDHAFDSMNARN